MLIVPWPPITFPVMASDDPFNIPNASPHRAEQDYDLDTIAAGLTQAPYPNVEDDPFSFFSGASLPAGPYYADFPTTPPIATSNQPHSGYPNSVPATSPDTDNMHNYNVSDFFRQNRATSPFPIDSPYALNQQERGEGTMNVPFASSSLSPQQNYDIHRYPAASPSALYKRHHDEGTVASHVASSYEQKDEEYYFTTALSDPQPQNFNTNVLSYSPAQSDVWEKLENIVPGPAKLIPAGGDELDDEPVDQELLVPVGPAGVSAVDWALNRKHPNLFPLLGTIPPPVPRAEDEGRQFEPAQPVASGSSLQESTSLGDVVAYTVHGDGAVCPVLVRFSHTFSWLSLKIPQDVEKEGHQVSSEIRSNLTILIFRDQAAVKLYSSGWLGYRSIVSNDQVTCHGLFVSFSLYYLTLVF